MILLLDGARAGADAEIRGSNESVSPTPGTIMMFPVPSDAVHCTRHKPRHRACNFYVVRTS